jgi:DNA invertase Pin-like site-specific DNA recombinase
MGVFVGYVRFATMDDDSGGRQIEALKSAGCQRIITDEASAALDERPGLARLLDEVRPGDTVVIWRLDRLGRSLRHLIETVNGLAERHVGFRSLTENIDTSRSGGTSVFEIFGALADFERELMRERSQAGLATARARGRRGGRPRVMTPDKVATARQMYDSKKYSVDAIARWLSVSRASIYRYVTDPAPNRVTDAGKDAATDD